MKTKAVCLKRHVETAPTEDDFELKQVEVQEQINDGEALVKMHHISVDPYMRVRMNKTLPPGYYFSNWQEGQVMDGMCIAEVVESKNSALQQGDIVSAFIKWQLYQVLDNNQIQNVQKIDTSQNIPYSYYLGALGLTGMTAYFGLLDIGEIKENDVVLISAASGAVGCIAGQIARIKGCYVIGITSSDEKCQELTERYQFHEAINHRPLHGDPNQLEQKIIEKVKACTGKEQGAGVDVYFDNVGTWMLEAALRTMNRYGRIALCGAISAYNDKQPMHPNLDFRFVVKELKAQGFLMGTFFHRAGEAIQALGSWFKEGKLQSTETIDKGIDNVPKAFIKLFTAEKKGKIVVDTTVDHQQKNKL